MKKSKEELKQFFETGDKPTQKQYADLIDSYIDAKQPAGGANRRFVIDEAGEVSVASEQKSPEYTLSDINNNKLSLLKDGVVVKELDLTNYIDDTNLARLVSGTLDVNGIATFTRDDNSTFTVDLSNLKDTQIQADFNQTNIASADFIKNKPDVITYDERSNLSTLSRVIQSYSITTYNAPSDIGALDFTQKKVYAIVNYNGANYIAFKENGSSTDTPIDVANHADLCVMNTNTNALLERTTAISIAGFNVFKLKLGGSLVFTPLDATRTVKLCLYTLKSVIDKSKFRTITSRLTPNYSFLANAELNSVNTTTTVNGVETSIGKPFDQYNDAQNEKIFKIDFLNKFIWKNGVFSINDLPNHIKFKVYLKPNNGSFFSNTTNKEILLYTVTATQSDLQNVSAGSKLFNNSSIDLILNKMIFGTLTTDVTYNQTHFDFNGNVLSKTFQNYKFYDNNSSVRRVIDENISFSVFIGIEVDNQNVVNPTPWSSILQVKHYLIEQIM
ncbi:hypothetical protein [uncultured Tenacibaculum sp.]|uniref:hypothetical protein n=1 Tax=uncultured Tenacibaculum sp. TaxID=174713 RepID=UPI00261CFB96|nr:hypothetical protein [uncultured Tenacibaculum sp.]